MQVGCQQTVNSLVENVNFQPKAKFARINMISLAGVGAKKVNATLNHNRKAL